VLNTFVGVTDFEWFQFLSSQAGIDEVNFWKPGGQQGFAALRPGEPFLFKLHAPRNVIAGGAFFTYFSKMPTSLAWDAFGIKNGARSLGEMRLRIEHYRRTPPTTDDYTIGCILLSQPFFFAERDWIPVPSDWKNAIVQGKTYDITSTPGLELWDAVRARLRTESLQPATIEQLTAGRYGAPVEILPRIGQGIFRVLVTDAYSRRCAMTGERTLPTLDAAHIRPFASPGSNRIPNGLLLRSDLHRLFDRGYVTVTPDYRLHVSRRIREEFENGRDYYALDNKLIALPAKSEHQPDRLALEWHADSVFLK
jgi:putative restriction endonuclease